ncbi:MAG: hypothetical protein LBV51_00575 [Acholeplasmatales bacterium]|jgi:hypothetical protein|nr:hypothetical protein [Acholeplasmatales bacterium]
MENKYYILKNKILSAINKEVDAIVNKRLSSKNTVISNKLKISASSFIKRKYPITKIIHSELYEITMENINIKKEMISNIEMVCDTKINSYLESIKAKKNLYYLARNYYLKPDNNDTFNNLLEGFKKLLDFKLRNFDSNTKNDIRQEICITISKVFKKKSFEKVKNKNQNCKTQLEIIISKQIYCYVSKICNSRIYDYYRKILKDEYAIYDVNNIPNVACYDEEIYIKRIEDLSYCLSKKEINFLKTFITKEKMLTQKEISIILNIKQPAVSRRLNRIKQKVKGKKNEFI